MPSSGVIEEQMEDMEVGRGRIPGSEECILMPRPVVDEEANDQLKPSNDDDDVEGIQRDVKPKKNASAKMALAVAATAAVELTNLFFLHSDTERQRDRRCTAGLTALGALTVLFAFAAFLLSATVLLLQPSTQHHLTITPAACSGVLLAASIALYVASVGTVFSLLHGL